MKRKILTVFLAALSALCLTFGLTACNNGGNGETVEDKPGKVEDFDTSGPPDYVGGASQNTGLLFEKNSDETYTVVGTDPEAEAKTDLVIPNTYEDLPVTAVKENAFTGRGDIVSVSIAGSVKTISNGAFSACSGLKSVRIPASVETLGERAFLNCQGLRAVIFAEGCAITTIAANTFAGCTDLAKFTVPENVTEICSEAFNGCSSLRTVEMGPHVLSVGERAFNKCVALDSLTIGSGVKTIANQAFASCSALKNIVIPDSVEEIGWGAFQDCMGVESVTIPFVGASKELAKLNPEEPADKPEEPTDDPEEQGGNQGSGESSAEKTAFGYIFGAHSHSDNDQINGGYVPATLTYVKVTGGERIAAYAFAYCYNLETVILADSIKVLDDDAFGQCMNVQTLVLGKGLQEIREALFGFRTYSASDPETLPLNIYYTGTAETWSSIFIDDTQPTPGFIPNNLIINAAKYYYSETEQDAQHWRYVNGMPEVY